LIQIFPIHKISVPETNTASLRTGINYKTCSIKKEAFKGVKSFVD